MGKRVGSAVVLGLSPTGLYVARELGGSGISLLGVDRDFGCASWSRYFRNGGGIWRDSDPRALLGRLMDYAATQVSPPCLLPTNDHYVEFIIANYSTLSKRFRISACYQSVAAKLLDKAKFRAVCDEQGIDQPRMWEVSGLGEFDKLAAEVTYPCILKPTMIHLARQYLAGKKVLLANDCQELRAHIRRMSGNTGSWLIQELVAGKESEIVLIAGYLASDGLADDYFSARKLRQYPPGFGSASLAISEPAGEAGEIAFKLLRAIGYNGVFGAEFKRDSISGQLKIIEINPRPTLWFALAGVSGKQLVATAFDDLSGAAPAGSVMQRNGVVWRYALKDLVASAFYRFRGRQFILEAPDVTPARTATARCWPVYERRDPLPVLAELIVYARKGLGRVF